VEYGVLRHFQQHFRYIVAVSVTLLLKKKSMAAVVLHLTLALSAKHLSSSKCTIQSSKMNISIFESYFFGTNK
jgi:hypothetical protein